MGNNQFKDKKRKVKEIMGYKRTNTNVVLPVLKCLIWIEVRSGNVKNTLEYSRTLQNTPKIKQCEPLAVSRPLFPTPPVSTQVSLKKEYFHSYLHENSFFLDKNFMVIIYDTYKHPVIIIVVKVSYSLRYEEKSISWVLLTIKCYK